MMHAYNDTNTHTHTHTHTHGNTDIPTHPSLVLNLTDMPAFTYSHCNEVCHLFTKTQNSYTHARMHAYTHTHSTSLLTHIITSQK